MLRVLRISFVGQFVIDLGSPARVKLSKVQPSLAGSAYAPDSFGCVGVGAIPSWTWRHSPSVPEKKSMPHRSPLDVPPPAQSIEPTELMSHRLFLVGVNLKKIRRDYFFFFAAFFLVAFFLVAFFLVDFFLAAFFLVAFFLAAFFLATVRPPLIKVCGELRLKGFQFP